MLFSERHGKEIQNGESNVEINLVRQFLGIFSSSSCLELNTLTKMRI